MKCIYYSVFANDLVSVAKINNICYFLMNYPLLIFMQCFIRHLNCKQNYNEIAVHVLEKVITSSLVFPIQIYILNQSEYRTRQKSYFFPSLYLICTYTNLSFFWNKKSITLTDDTKIAVFPCLIFPLCAPFLFHNLKTCPSSQIKRTDVFSVKWKCKFRAGLIGVITDSKLQTIPSSFTQSSIVTEIFHSKRRKTETESSYFLYRGEDERWSELTWWVTGTLLNALLEVTWVPWQCRLQKKPGRIAQYHDSASLNNLHKGYLYTAEYRCDCIAHLQTNLNLFRNKRKWQHQPVLVARKLSRIHRMMFSCSCLTKVLLCELVRLH